ncbi:hypothetical protein D3C84_799050 [compost metagenome]
MAGVLVERAVQGQRVDLRQQFVQWQTIRAGRAPRDLAQQHAHAKGFSQPRDRAAQFAVTEQTEGFAFQFDDRVVQQAELFCLLPATFTDGFLIIGQARGQVEQQHDRVLRHRWRAVTLAVADGHAMGAGGGEVDVIGAGGGDQDQLQLGAGGDGGGIDQDFVADGDGGALEAFDHLVRRGLREQLQFAETGTQRAEVEIAQVQGGMVEENGAVRVRHQLYLLCIELKA